MDAVGNRNLGAFFTGVVVGRDPNMFCIVGPSEITNLALSSIGTIKQKQYHEVNPDL